MSIPGWFNAQYYMNAKLASVQATNSSMTLAQLHAVFSQAGFGGEEGQYAHFLAFGQYEGLSPNNAFDAEQYCVNKAAQVFATAMPNTVQVNEVKAAFNASGFSPWSHYNAFGILEGINPGGVGFVTPPPQPSNEQVIEFSGGHRSVMQAQFDTTSMYNAATVKLNNVFSARGLHVQGAGEVTLNVNGANTLLEDDTPAAVFGNSLRTLKITGSPGSSLTLEETTAGTVDASAFSGSLRISLSDDFATTVIGSQGNDLIISDGRADTLTGGGGNDTFRFDDDLDGYFSAWTLHNHVAAITDFSRGDRIDVTDAARGMSRFASVASRQAGSESDLVTFIRDHLAGGERAVQAVYYNGDTYLAVNGDTYDTDDDVVVKLVGIQDTASLLVENGIITHS